MTLDISTTISLSTCRKRSALGWPIGVKMKISKKGVKGLTSWLLFVMFIVTLLFSHLVSWDRCGTWLYRFLIIAVFLLILLI